MEYAPLHDGVLAEDALHPCGEGLAAVDDDEQALFEAEPPGDEIGQEVLDDRRVLGVALPDADGDLRACGGDQERIEMADFEPPRATCSSSSPMGSATSAWRLVATPASIRSTATWVSRSRSLNST